MIDILAAHKVMDKYARRIEHPDVYNVSIGTPWRILGFVVYLKTDKPFGGFHPDGVLAMVATLCAPYLGEAPWEHLSYPLSDAPFHKHIFRCVLAPEEEKPRTPAVPPTRAIGWAVETTQGTP